MMLGRHRSANQLYNNQIIAKIKDSCDLCSSQTWDEETPNFPYEHSLAVLSSCYQLLHSTYSLNSGAKIACKQLNFKQHKLV